MYENKKNQIPNTFKVLLDSIKVSVFRLFIHLPCFHIIFRYVSYIQSFLKNDEASNSMI